MRQLMDRRLVVSGVLVLLAVSMISAAFVGPAYAQPLDVTVETDKDNYLHGETMVVSGHVSCPIENKDASGATVTIEIHYPSPNNTVRTYPKKLTTDQKGRFVTDPGVPIRFSETAPLGTYRIVAKASWAGREGEGYTYVYLATPEEVTGNPQLVIEMEKPHGMEWRWMARIGEPILFAGYVKAKSARKAGLREPVEGAEVTIKVEPANADWLVLRSTVTDEEGYFEFLIDTSTNLHASVRECEGTWKATVRASKDGFEDSGEYPAEISLVNGVLQVTAETDIFDSPFASWGGKEAAAPGDMIKIRGEVRSQIGPEDGATVTIKFTDPNGGTHTFNKRSGSGYGYYQYCVILINETVTGEESLDSRQVKLMREDEELGLLSRISTVAGTWSIEVEATKEGYSPASASTTFEAEAPAASSPPSRNTEIIAAGAVAAAAIAVSAAVLKSRYGRHEENEDLHLRNRPPKDE
jgi:hypothetical protein